MIEARRPIMTKFLTLACFCFIVSSCEVLHFMKTSPVAGPGQILNFKNYSCSEAKRGKGSYWHSYALFEAHKPHRAASLGVISVGWDEALPGNYRQVSFELEKMQMESFTDWAGDQFDLSLKMQNAYTGISITGSKNKLFFIHNEKLNKTININYKVSHEGVFEWEQFRESENLAGMVESVRQYFSGNTFIREENIFNPQDSYILILVVENLRTGETIEMEGPTLNSPSQLWENTIRPESKFSGNPIETIGHLLNPLEEGNIWGEGPRYNNCLIPRELAKGEFDIRFKKLKRK